MPGITQQHRAAPSPAREAPGDLPAGFSARAARRQTAARFARCVADLAPGALDCPLPGSGRTAERFAALASVAEQDLCLARLVEDHVDGVAILAERGGPPVRAGERWGVRAAEPPGLTAIGTERGRLLNGLKPYGSGARSRTHAPVTATAEDGRRHHAERGLAEPGGPTAREESS